MPRSAPFLLFDGSGSGQTESPPLELIGVPARPERLHPGGLVGSPMTSNRQSLPKESRSRYRTKEIAQLGDVDPDPAPTELSGPQQTGRAATRRKGPKPHLLRCCWPGIIRSREGDWFLGWVA